LCVDALVWVGLFAKEPPGSVAELLDCGNTQVLDLDG
jgi:hypothetical protein